MISEIQSFQIRIIYFLDMQGVECLVQVIIYEIDYLFHQLNQNVSSDCDSIHAFCTSNCLITEIISWKSLKISWKKPYIKF